MYSDIQNRITHESESPRTIAIARDTLMWILYAIRPLTPMELIAAISMTPLALGFDTNGLTVKTILDVCQNLVVFDEKLDVLRFAHYSVQEFLLLDLEPADCHTQVAEVCLTLLTHHYMTPGTEAPALMDYSTLNWPVHVQSSGTGSDALHSVDSVPETMSGLRHVV